MKTIKISRENLIDREFGFIEEIVEVTEEKVNMDKELGDFLFKLFKSALDNNQGNTLRFVMRPSRFKMNMCLNFVVRNNDIQNIMQEVSILFRKNINRLMGSHILTSINLIVLEDGEEYIASSESNEYEEMMNLTNLEEIA